MGRTRKDPVLLAQMCERLTVVIDMTDMYDAELSQLLGYANATTLSSVRRGVAFPDVERLALLGQMVLMNSAAPNLHWILTGVGPPFVPAQPQRPSQGLDSLNEVALLRLQEGSGRFSRRHR